MKFLTTRELLSAKGEARKVRNKAAHFSMINGILYKWGFSIPLRSISKEEAHYVLEEVHREICGNHSRERVLATKIMRTEYYWPHALSDAREVTKRCIQCQQWPRVTHSRN